MATCQAGTGAVRRRQQNKRDRKIQKSNTKAAKRIRQRDNKKTPTHNQESSRASLSPSKSGAKTWQGSGSKRAAKRL